MILFYSNLRSWALLLFLIAIVLSLPFSKAIKKSSSVSLYLDIICLGAGQLALRKYKNFLFVCLASFAAVIIYQGFLNHFLYTSTMSYVIHANKTMVNFILSFLFTLVVAFLFETIRDYEEMEEDLIEMRRKTDVLRNNVSKLALLRKGTNKKNHYSRKKGLVGFKKSLDECIKKDYSICVDTNFFMEIVRTDERLLDQMFKVNKILVSSIILDELEKLKNQGDIDLKMKVQKGLEYIRRLDDREKIVYVGQDAPADFYKFIKSKNLNSRSNDDVIISHYLHYKETSASSMRHKMLFKKTKLIFFSEDKSALSRAKSRGLSVVKLFDEPNVV